MRNVWIVMGTIFLAMGGVVSAGPLHEAAMGLVRQGEAVSDTGNLDAAMEIYWGVEKEYPEEIEVIGWARYRISECLAAGWRWSEAATAIRWGWERVMDGSVTDPDARFWFGKQYAKCLEKIWDLWNLALVCEEMKDIYLGRPEPGPGMESAYGWTRYWAGTCFFEKGQFAWAYSAGQEAFEIGKRIMDGAMASGARLLQGRAMLEDGNTLLANQIFLECRQNYALFEGAEYRVLVNSGKARAEAILGFTDQARESVLSMLNDPNLDGGGVIDAACRFATAAITRDATLEVLGVLAIGKVCFPHVPHWGNRADLLWTEILGTVGEEVFQAGLLEAIADAKSPLEEACLRILVSGTLNVAGENAAALEHLERAKAVCSDPRMRLAWRRAAHECGGPEEQPELLEIYFDEVKRVPEDRARVEYAVGFIRRLLWVGWDPPTPWLEWLDANADALPRDYVLLQKAWAIRDGGDPEAALPLLNEVLSSGGGDRWEAHTVKAVSLFRLHRWEEAVEALNEFEREFTTPSRLERGYSQMAHSLKNHNVEAAIHILDRAIATGRDARECILGKADLLWYYMKQPEAALEYYDRLTALPPDFENTRGGVVGYAILATAQLYDQEFGDTQHAFDLLEIAISSEAIPEARGAIFREYAKMLQREGRYEDAQRVSDQGMEVLPRTEKTNLAWLSAVREAARYEIGTISREDLNAFRNAVENAEIREYLENEMSGRVTR